MKAMLMVALGGALGCVARYQCGALVLHYKVRLLIFTGFLGGFTTSSAFGVETVSRLVQKGEWGVAAYVLLSVACGLAALWAALKVGGMADG